MNNDMSIFSLVAEASFVVQLVMLILLLASVISWTFILSKRKELNLAEQNTEQFEQTFWASKDLSQLYQKTDLKGANKEAIENIFTAGYKEFSRMNNLADVNAQSKV